MNFLGTINEKIESKHNFVNSEKTFVNNRERKLADDNYIIVKYNGDVQYSSGFQNGARTKIRFIEYQNQQYTKEQPLSISADTEIKVYLLPDVTSLESFFDSSFETNFEKIISVDLSNFGSSLITNINSMFKGCTSITNINFSNFITSQIQYMSKLFYGCSSLESLDLSNFDTSSVINMEYMFYDCTSLKFLDISTFVDDNFENNGGVLMFSNLNSLQYINIYNIASSGKLAQALSSYLIDNANFIVCQKNRIITNNNAINACCNYNDDNSKCEFPNYMIIKYSDEVQYLDGFQINPRTYIRFIEYGNKYYRGNEALSISAGTEIKVYFLPDITSLESFFDNEIDLNVIKILSVDLSNFNSSLITNLNKMFYGCTIIKNINFSNFITSKINTMSDVFDSCWDLISLDLSNFDTSSVINMDYMFFACYSLQTLTLSSKFITSKVESMRCMFHQCKSLTSIDLSNFDTSSVINMDYMFFRCDTLKNIDLSNFNTSLVTNMEGMFSQSAQIQSLDLSNFDTPLLQNSESMFEGCTQLQYIDLSNFKSSKINSMNNMFKGCSNLQFLDISIICPYKI